VVKIRKKDGNYIGEVPFSSNLENYKKEIKFDELDDAQDDALTLYEKATNLIKPTFIISEKFIDQQLRSESITTVKVGSEKFEGKALAVLDSIHRIFPYLATCGNQVENLDLSSIDFLAFYWIDIIKIQALDSSRKAMLSFVKEKFGITKPLSLNPGSGNVDIWPIEQMGNLFNLFGGKEFVEKETGTQLTPSSLMVPNKSVAGILFSSTKYDYESCAYCERLHCPSRRVPFKERL
jgi:hypothetical protein